MTIEKFEENQLLLACKALYGSEAKYMFSARITFEGKHKILYAIARNHGDAANRFHHFLKQLKEHSPEAPDRLQHFMKQLSQKKRTEAPQPDIFIGEIFDKIVDGTIIS
jgi:hypothetical protein